MRASIQTREERWRVYILEDKFFAGRIAYKFMVLH